MNPFRKALEKLDGGKRWSKGAYHTYNDDEGSGDAGDRL